ncbi:hypothetical protein [Bacteroides graminisolvens]|uniref:hypothetical protein n=1 Tax=Bacteroides graminisolvens TaxID=477666 RepID=UPI0024099F19|nr:hypothetical protein [Bacteroides graminisolvens]
MTFFIILLVLFLTIIVSIWLIPTNWEEIDEKNKEFYTQDGYHIYYDRKILRRLQEEETKAQKQNH